MTTIDAAGLFGNPSTATGGGKRRDPAQFSMRGRVIWGTLFAVALIGGVGGWAVNAKLTGAVIGQGRCSCGLTPPRPRPSTPS